MTRSRNVGRSYRQPPVAGLDFRIPTGALNSQYAAFMMNFHAQNGRLVKRNPHTTVFSRANGSNLFFLTVPYESVSGIQTIAIGTTHTEDGSSSVASPSDFAVATGQIGHNYFTTFNNKILVPSDTNAATNTVHIFDPDAFTWSTGFTFSTPDGIAVDYGTPICSYRERIYFVNNKTLYYGAVGATSGATSTFDLSYLIQGQVHAIEELSYSNGSTIEQLLILVTNTGEVLVFSGANPGASDWVLNSTIKVPVSSPVGFTLLANKIELIKLPNDLLISTYIGTEIYSVNDLLSAGRASIFSPTEPLKQLTSRSLYLSAPNNLLNKGVCYWGDRNSLVVILSVNTSKIPLLNDWDSYFTDKHAFVVDLDNGSIELHSVTMDGFLPKSLQSAGDYIINANATSIIRLFDSDASDDSIYDDFDTTAITAAVVLAPPNDLGYRMKALKDVVVYANTHNSHNVSVGVRKDFQTAPASTYSVIDSTISDTTIKSHVKGVNEINHAPMVSIIEDSSHSTPFEFHGLDMIFEEGGEY